jgi:hypothetical protein
MAQCSSRACDATLAWTSCRSNIGVMPLANLRCGIDVVQCALAAAGVTRRCDLRLR